jgi:superfamily II DNA or RNA helicase
MSQTYLEAGRNVRWRGRRWRVVEEESAGIIRLVGIDPVNRGQVVAPLMPIEARTLEPDVLPPLELDATSSDRGQWRAMHLAYLTTLAGGREQLVGLDWGAVAVEPYQLVPLMRVARSIRPRLLIADDTGLGKTAEAGLILRWLAQRHQASRVLVVTRASPEPERWQRELWIKFGFEFDILRSGADFAERRRRAPTINVFAQEPRAIVSMSLAARQLFLDELRQCPTPFDVVIVDEAHHLAERGSGTKRLTVLGRALRDKCRDGALLLLTATPHDGKTESFLSLLKLLDPFVEVEPGAVAADASRRLVVRRLKSEVTLSGGRRFREPRIHVVSTLRYASPSERGVNAPLNAYLEWLAGEEARYRGAGSRAMAQGCQFLAGVYRKRFGSSVAALRATLRRRLGLPPAPEDADESVPLVLTDASDPEDDVLDPGAVAETPPPPLSAAEEGLARALLDAANQVRPGRDAKLEATIELLRGQLAGQKVVIFTEYRDTLRAASRRLAAEGIPFVTFHGETSDLGRERAMASFIRDPEIRVFLGTDAASEGKNLQHSAHHLVHVDVPWNPNRYAQRNGRIDRYGQSEEPNIWVLIAADRKRGQGRPEDRALEVVVNKLQRIQSELGSVSPVLPGFSRGLVQDVLLAGRGDVEEAVEQLLDDPDFAKPARDLSRLAVANRDEIEVAERYVGLLGTTDDFAGTVGGLLQTAFRSWDDGGSIEPLFDGVVRVRVPARLQRELGRPVVERATFLRSIAVSGQDEEAADTPEFLSPGHPLVDATLRRLRDDATDPSFRHRFDVEIGDPEALVLTFVARFVDGEGRTVEERLLAVQVFEGGSASPDADGDLRRLGIGAVSSPGAPSATAVEAWRGRFPEAVAVARSVAEERSNARREELVELAQQIRDEEIGVLEVWRAEEKRGIELLTLGTAAQLTVEGVTAFQQRVGALEAEFERRRALVRDRSSIRLAAIDAIGGRLFVRPSS